METEIAILLGAGSSVAAGFPTTNELTDLWCYPVRELREATTAGLCYVGDTDEPSPVVLKLVKSMVRRLHAEAERYYSAYGERPTNYEDIYYLALQASDELSGNMENPAIRMFVNELKADMSPLLDEAAATKNGDSHETYEQYMPKDFKDLIEKTCKHIEDVVSESLSHCPTPESIRQLGVIEDACNSFKVTSISTLCHDTHVETFLNSKGVALSDGFSETRSGCTKDGLAVDPPDWNPDDLTSDLKTPFLKLHGSVNWFPYNGTIRRIPAGCSSQRIKIGSDFLYPDKGPSLLIGTFNKISNYSSGIFRELHYRFRSTIKDASRLVICGYSFGDKGINGEIFDWVRGVDWVHGKEERRLVIIHPDPMDLFANARGAIQQILDDWETNPLIKIIEQRFEDVSFTELEKAISP